MKKKTNTIQGRGSSKDEDQELAIFDPVTRELISIDGFELAWLEEVEGMSVQEGRKVYTGTERYLLYEDLYYGGYLDK